MKKLFTLFLLAAISVLPLTAEAKKSITVPSPTLMNGGTDDAWIPAYVQGLLTTNFQNYSEMQVIDRMNTAKIMKEQKLAESMADMQSEEDQIKIGKLVSAKYTVAVQIIKKGNDYSLDIKIDDTETGASVGKAYTNPSCSNDDLTNGRAVYLASYDLLKGLGISESKLRGLKDAADEASSNKSDAVKSNTSVAKGIVAERKGNVVEAMAYFNQAGNKIAEAAERLQQIGVSITTGNDGESLENQVANEIQRRLQQQKLEDQWNKIWEQYADYERWHWASVSYYPDFKVGDIKYGDTVEDSTVKIGVDVHVEWNPNCKQLYNQLLELAEKAGVEARFDRDSSKSRVNINRYYLVNFTLYADGNEISRTVSKGYYTIINPPSEYDSFGRQHYEFKRSTIPIDVFRDSDGANNTLVFNVKVPDTSKKIELKAYSTIGPYGSDGYNSPLNLEVLEDRTEEQRKREHEQGEIAKNIIEKRIEFVTITSGGKTFEISRNPLKFGDIMDLGLENYAVEKKSGCRFLVPSENSANKTQKEIKKHKKELITFLKFGSRRYDNINPLIKSLFGNAYRLPTPDEIKTALEYDNGNKIFGTMLTHAGVYFEIGSGRDRDYITRAYCDIEDLLKNRKQWNDYINGGELSRQDEARFHLNNYYNYFIYLVKNN